MTFLKGKLSEKKKRKTDSKKKDTKTIKTNEKEVVFKDVRLFRIMPLIFMLGVILVGSGAGYAMYANHKYQVAQGKLSMAKNTTLPILTGSSDYGTLTLGNSILSKDRKHLAVEFKYNDTAHSNLSAFGRNYRLWFVTDDKYDTTGITMKYGFFGTDGVGVMQISSPKPFENKAFIVMLMDKSSLVTDDNLSGENVSDETIDKSITAQLAGASDDSSDSESTGTDENKSAGRAVYYARINPYSAKHSRIDWGNDERELVNTLFIRDNLKKIAQQKKADSEKVARAKKKLAEYQERLRENPNDSTASEGVDNLNSTIQSLNENLATETKNYNHLASYNVQENILGRQQTKYRLLKYSSDKFNYLNGNN